MSSTREREPLRRTIFPVLRLARSRHRNGETPKLGELLDGMGPNGSAILIMLLCMPFVIPVSLGPITVAISTVIMALAVTVVEPSTQKTLNRWINIGISEVVVRALRNMTAWTARFRHREKRMPVFSLMPQEVRRALLASIIIFHAILLALPIPLLPLTNTLPALSIALFALAILRRNDLHTIFGTLATLVTFAWFGAIAYLGISGAQALFYTIVSWARSLFS